MGCLSCNFTIRDLNGIGFLTPAAVHFGHAATVRPRHARFPHRARKHEYIILLRLPYP
jgi:hypothetical protein